MSVFTFGGLVAVERGNGRRMGGFNLLRDCGQTIRKQEVTIYASATTEDKPRVVNGWCVCFRGVH
jgi:hypothetical protein